MKFVILTDSTGSPRIYPKSERVDLDQTYPYLLKKKYNKCKFWQLSLGNQISELLIRSIYLALSNNNNIIHVLTLYLYLSLIIYKIDTY